MDRISIKVVLLGEGRVGKTSIVVRYCNDEFNEKQQSTIQASHLAKRVTIGETHVTLNVWDTAGQERYSALGPIYYRDADGALLVYDITDVDSFTRVKNWVRELRKIVGEEISICIAGNKCDLERHRHVAVQDAQEYSAAVGAQHFNTSAKLNDGVDDVFLALTKQIVDKKKEEASRGGNGGRRKKQKSLLLVPDEPEAAQKEGPAAGGCC